MASHLFSQLPVSSGFHILDAIFNPESLADGKPSMSHGTLMVVPLLLRTSDYWNSTPWSAYINAIHGARVEVLVSRTT
jgi:hypothetical protein